MTPPVPGLWRRLAGALAKADRRDLMDGLDDEIRFHVEQQIEKNVRSGMAPDEARRQALVRFGGVAQTRERTRDQLRIAFVDTFARDVRYGFRSLRRHPGFTAMAVLSLAIGIGANTAIFSVVNAVMLRPLPYVDAHRLVRLWESNQKIGRARSSVSAPNFLDWRAHVHAFTSLAAVSNAGGSFATMSGAGAEIVRGAAVTAEFLPVLGVMPALGRNFRADEDRPGGDTRVAVLSEGYWKRRFASDPAILGRQIALNGNNYSVVGVLPASFSWGNTNIDLLVPLAPNPSSSRGDHRLTVIGRLTDGVTIERAQTELASVAARLAAQYPADNEGWSAATASFDEWLIPDTARNSLVILLGAVGLVLLIACANVASLMLARAAARQKELTMRVALGAARWRIVQQVLTESLLISLLACVAGTTGGAAAVRLLVAYGPAGVPRLDEASFDLNVLLFALAVSVATAFVFGIAPALQVSRTNPAGTLQNETRGASSGRSRQRLRGALTVIEVALSVALLIGAGLLLRSFWSLQNVDAGFSVTPLMTMRVALPSAAYPNARIRDVYYERLLAAIRTLPGVVSAATSSSIPLAGGNTVTEVQLPGDKGRLYPSADWRVVSPAYFATMGIPLRGRDFSPEDRERSAYLTIISETMAREYWPNQDPIGRTVILSSMGNRERTIIGVAGDVRHFGLDTEPRPMVYYSTVEVGGQGSTVVWRSAVDPSSHVAAIRDIVRRLDPTVPIYDVQSLPDLLSVSLAPRKFNMYLLAIFAAVAVLLAAIGLFGLMAYLVSQRTREIGVRLVLGADRGAIFRLILGRGLALASIGVAIGVVGAFSLTRAMQRLLFGVSAADPATFVAVPALLVVVALVACYVPARRAMQVDPATALRAE
jgi:putative ABC transport system permease protein